MILDQSTWIAAVACAAAVLAALFAFWSANISKRALLLAQQQEGRRQPTLSLYLNEGYYTCTKHGKRHRVYAFLLSISNPSEIDNSVAQLDLYLSYVNAAGLKMTLKIPVDNEAGDPLHNEANGLIVPKKVDAHESVAGWCYFSVNEKLISDKKIEGYQIVVSDSHRKLSTIEPSIISEMVNEHLAWKKRKHTSSRKT